MAHFAVNVKGVAGTGNRTGGEEEGVNEPFVTPFILARFAREVKG
jgi:hypothetical protein